MRQDREPVPFLRSILHSTTSSVNYLFISILNYLFND